MNTLRPGSTLISTTDNLRFRQVVSMPQELRPDEGMFCMVDNNGYRTFGKLTGRTTRRWGMLVPTVERYTVETVVIDGAIWGIPGERIAGTFFTRPENVVQENSTVTL